MPTQVGLGRGFASVVGLTALSVFATLYMLWPRATVAISAPESEVRREFEIRASMAATEIDVEGACVPARVVQASFTVSATVPASGLVRSGATKARGVVVFINDAPRPVSVPRDTVVATAAGVRFRTLADIVVPASVVRHYMGVTVDADPGMAKTSVEAKEPGMHGNVAAGRITVVVDGAKPHLKVMNPEPTVGGEDAVTPAVSALDLMTARKRLAAEAAKTAVSRLVEGAPAGFRVLGETLVTELGEPVFSQAPLTPSTQLRASCRTHAKALAVREEDVLRVARGLFCLGLDDGKARVVSPEVEVRLGKVKRVDDETAVIRAAARALVAEGVDVDKLAMELAGMSISEAESLLSERHGEAGFSIQPAGGVAGRLPRFPLWIRVVVRRPEAKSL
ncbi:MAG: baseplate J/gp47 family protein [Firmicutes bacterium]|nr:baseplate J/gp47 family protein [Bacillota bacterium]MDH7495597.1 baseplate J/gp47 family protein [Bacillota bacterium]